VASYDRSIPPGGEGKITVTVNTEGYEGSIYKTASVQTNDPLKSRFNLAVKAFVRVPITVSPRFVILRGKADQELSLNVKIEAGLEKPLQIEADRSRLEGRVRYEIQEIEEGRSYRIRFTSVPGKPGRFSGFLNLTTNYEEKPLLNIRIRADFRK
jgi:hypothetical protein